MQINRRKAQCCFYWGIEDKSWLMGRWGRWDRRTEGRDRRMEGSFRRKGKVAKRTEGRNRRKGPWDRITVESSKW